MIYFENVEELIEIHSKTIQHSGGGVNGILQRGLLDSALGHIQNDDYYPNFEDKLCHLFWSMCKNHIFQDGNKRMAITASVMFLMKNGHMVIAKRFMEEMEAISYHVAAGNIDKDLLLKIITSFLFEDDYSEEVKLEIAIAFAKGLPDDQ